MTHQPTTCRRPAPKARYASRLWICPDCGQAWHTTRTQPSNIAPTGLSWWWRRWPWISGPDGDVRIEDQ